MLIFSRFTNKTLGCLNSSQHEGSSPGIPLEYLGLRLGGADSHSYLTLCYTPLTFQKTKLHGATKWKVRGSLKSWGFIPWGAWISVKIPSYLHWDILLCLGLTDHHSHSSYTLVGTDIISFLCLCRSWRRWIGMGTVANTNWGTNWSKPSTWCLEAAERRGRANGLMDRWTGGWMGWVGKKNGGGGSEGILLNSELFEQSAERLSVGPNWKPQPRPFSNQSISNLLVNWWIDWFEDWWTDWLGPQLPPFGGYWGRK